ncbi:MAG: ATP-binding protein [Bacteroidota bacterium]
MDFYIQRRILDRLQQRLGDHKAIVVQGARQVGKTTLINQLLANRNDVIWINGDNPTSRLRWNNIDLATLTQMTQGYEYLVIDEAQRIENIGLTTKMAIDNRLPIKVILSGSSALNLASSVNEPLTGRKWSYELFPLSWEELVGAYRLPPMLDRLEERLLYGCYPEVVTQDSKEERLREIAASYLYKDILEYGNVRKPDLIIKLLQALAYQISAEVSYHELSRLLGVDVKTIQRYIQLLEDSYVLLRLPALSTNPRKEISTSRKIYFLDNGIRNAVIDNFNPLRMRNDRGPLWENFIITELYKQRRNIGGGDQFYFWRSRSQAEVDLVIRSSGHYEVFECKYNPRKATNKLPDSFMKRYEPIAITVVHTENFYQVLNAND